MTPKKFYKTVLILTLISSGIIIGGMLFSWKMMKNLSRSVYEKEVHLNNYTNKVNVLNALKLNYEKNLPFLDKVLYSLPKEKKADVFMVDLETIASQTGVKVTIYKYVAPQGKAKKKAEVPTDLNLTQAVKVKDYYEVPLNVVAEGQYPNVINFMKKAESLRRLHNIKNVEIVKVKKDDVPADYIQLISDVSTYFKE